MATPMPFAVGLGEGRILVTGRRGTVTAAATPASKLQYLANVQSDIQQQLDQVSQGGGGGGSNISFGMWEPVVTGDGPESEGPLGGQAFGNYFTIGSIIFWTLDVTWTGLSGRATGELIITGLPNTSSGVHGTFAASVGRAQLADAEGILQMTVPPNGNTIRTFVSAGFSTVPQPVCDSGSIIASGFYVQD